MKKFIVKTIIAIITSGFIFGLIGYNLSEQYKTVFVIEKQIVERFSALDNRLAKIDKSVETSFVLDLKMINAIIQIADATEFLHKQSNILTTKYDNLTDILPTTIDKRILQDKINKLFLEKRLQQLNVFIKNKTKESLGSGVTIKYNNKYYVLSAAHLAENLDDELWLCENDNEITRLKIVKIDKATDLLLLESENPEIQPHIYTTLAKHEPTTAQEIYVVGNPAGLEDIVSTGRVALYDNNFMMCRVGCFFGNSGGAVYNTKGEVIGIVSAVGAYSSGSEIPNYQIDVFIRLNAIREFLKEGV